MTTVTRSELKAELLAREKEYLRAVQAKDGEAAARLTAPESLVVSAHGAMKVDGAAIGKMIEEHDASKRYELDEDTVEVMRVTDGVAIISYRLRTTMQDGASLEAYDTDVWVQREGGWKCALHTEVPRTEVPAEA
jgi:uncharacterized protein (TIGR02246 family)